MTQSINKKLTVRYQCSQEDDGQLLVDVLSKNSDLSKSLIKRLMTTGSVFQTIRSKKVQARKAKITVKNNDFLECNYDPSIDFEKEYLFTCVYETKNYGVYLKPAGALTEGTKYGDKNSLLRHVEKIKRYVYLVNRIDKEAKGLVVVAFNSKSQNLLQQIWREGVQKKYQAIVYGELFGEGSFEDDINNKFSKTFYKSIKSVQNTTYLEIEAVTERKNQIRLHLAQNRTPVMGDNLFGRHNKNDDGLKLISYELKFSDPHNQKDVHIRLPKNMLLF